MKSLALVIIFLTASAIANVMPYKTSLMTMGTRYRALHTCNCLYVIKMSADYCVKFSQIDPPVFTVEIDAINKTVLSGIMGMDFKPAVAKYANARTGCQLVSP